MASLEELRQVRLQKIDVLKKHGIDPYPIKTAKQYENTDVIQKFETLSKEKTLTLAGRVMSLRPQGGLIFLNFNDGSAVFQALLKKGDTLEKDFDLFSETVDVGDFVEVTGSLFETKRGEKTLLVSSWRMLSKAILPLPEKWHGLQDVEERFRKRYLDLIASPEVKQRFTFRSRLITELRASLERAGFLEVETSMLQTLAGGTNAEPFKTHHNALQIDLHLRIAQELDLKKLLIGGFPKVYEIGRNFRNEGIDVTHNPEFTTVEWYQAYSDASGQMAFVEKIIKGLVEKIAGGAKIIYGGNEVDFSKKFKTATFYEILEKHASIHDAASLTLDALKKKAAELKIKVDDSDTLEKVLDTIYKRICRPYLIQPTFITDFPIHYLPLAKKKSDDPKLVDAFQLVAGGMELVKAFSELNDPLDQRARFAEQEKNRKAGDKEAQPNDEAFLEALEHGMPPAGGVGIGIDRLTMLLNDQKNIREVIFFPTLRPKGDA
ncbi:MAG: lysine--tRNA ligase [Candidatus Taylorbacteria bacterium RIFCSPHIGHO2_01_FULL_45_63]|uniref:Lysine--tRNA ligase n=1 Tax=Candidatus Taylorbacteria bacterium RIFCSPHIGHO2_02_FULL_45_35 TaxID=1802311 RepID=A0A1G2MW32_9BACT|nr:MAG: lysine--tRNA ligase [Candidatus Taylorbacteria bacterium RIFCSPHIGHO2_01_FULL_45_63]OHA28076.1 MAG: lysine--tRNA ligase [Candidatus Taylorbacteria bacterium RIFCSPHIGHO2_02_FULL_45_35]OHA34901.1 MAG: lysine--tRNA ligase [Candidatus Taylorbacteria bacterium RIFCSPLOWO2_01_FULL_45_34b]